MSYSRASIDCKTIVTLAKMVPHGEAIELFQLPADATIKDYGYDNVFDEVFVLYEQPGSEPTLSVGSSADNIEADAHVVLGTKL